MALSGTILQNAASEYPNWKLRAAWSAAQDRETNTSTVTVILSVYNGYASSGNSAWYSLQGYSRTAPYDWSGTGWHEIGRTTFNVKHDSNGSGSADISAMWYSNTADHEHTPASIALSETITLDTITPITGETLLITGNHIIGDTETVYIVGYDDQKIYGVTATISGDDYTLIDPEDSNAQASWYVPVSIAYDNQKHEKLPCTFTLTTYEDNEGEFEPVSEYTKSLQLNVPRTGEEPQSGLDTQGGNEIILNGGGASNVPDLPGHHTPYGQSGSAWGHAGYTYMSPLSADNSRIKGGPFLGTTAFISQISRIFANFEFECHDDSNSVRYVLTSPFEVTYSEPVSVPYSVVQVGSGVSLALDRVVKQNRIPDAYGNRNITVMGKAVTEKGNEVYANGGDRSVYVCRYIEPGIWIPTGGMRCDRCTSTSTVDNLVISDEGTKLYIKVNLWACPLGVEINGSVVKNQFRLWFDYKESTDNSYTRLANPLVAYTDCQDGNYLFNAVVDVGGNGLDPDKSYRVRLTLEDKMCFALDGIGNPIYNSYSVEFAVGQKFCSLNLGYGGKSIGIGQLAHGRKTDSTTWGTQRLDVANGYDVYLHGTWSRDDSYDLLSRIHALEQSVYGFDSNGNIPNNN